MTRCGGQEAITRAPLQFSGAQGLPLGSARSLYPLFIASTILSRFAVPETLELGE